MSTGSEGPESLVSLLAATARRDRAAFARLYHQSSPKLFGVALRIVRREDWAEDVLQECYVRIWDRAGDYREGLASPMTWMASIVRNRCLDWLRRPRFEISDEDGAIAEATASGDPEPLQDLERSDEARAIARCLAGLDAKHRQAIFLAFYEGRSHSELAAQMREPLGTVKTWVRRGLMRLKACLQGASA
jgi:RNA polymerase sigma-70 factor (ECF subfamily)